MTLDYEKSPPTNSTHDHVYTTLLGVLAFLLLCFPLGTALGFYGLRRVDKNLPRSSI